MFNKKHLQVWNESKRLRQNAHYSQVVLRNSAQVPLAIGLLS